MKKIVMERGRQHRWNNSPGDGLGSLYENDTEFKAESQEKSIVGGGGVKNLK